MSCVMQAKSAFLCVGGECFYNLIMAKKLAKLHCLGQNKIESYFSRIGVNAMNKNVALYNEMIAFFAGDARRCQHFIKVASLAKQLAESEGADAELTELVEAAGLVHDCGIKAGEAKYGAGHCTGKIQEQEGPSVARGLLQKVGYTPEKIERICYLVGHHHTYNMIERFFIKHTLKGAYLSRKKGVLYVETYNNRCAITEKYIVVNKRLS